MSSTTKKISLIGNFGVGKTSLTRRFVEGVFSDIYLTTIGVNIQKKNVQLNNHVIKMVIWDIAGEASISEINQNYLKGSHGIIWVFDATRPGTWLNIEEEFALLKNILPEVAIVTCINKTDVVDINQEKINTTFPDHIKPILTSAKTGTKVNELFEKLGAALV